MKKYSIFLITILSVVTLLSSCEKVIELNLNSSSPAIVIQGNVYDHTGPYQVTISNTVIFNNSNDSPPVTNAKVTISDNKGNSEILTQITDGTYQTSTLKGIPGNTYFLSVEIAGKIYTASSTMPPSVNIDSIYLEKGRFGNNDVAINFRDPPNIDNYYRVKEFLNDSSIAGNNVGNDKLYKGLMIAYKIDLPSETGNNPLKKGDKIKIQLQCIDKGVYEYFRTFRGNSGYSASPSNPTSNITNGALGYFSASSVQQDSIVFH